MSVRREVRLICDNCGAFPAVFARFFHGFGTRGVRVGVVATNGGHLCEDCVNVIDGGEGMSVCEVCNHYADHPDTIWLRISPVAAPWQQHTVCSPRCGVLLLERQRPVGLGVHL